MSQVYRALVPGGSLVFSVEHPIYTAPAEPNWSLDAAGRKTWPVDGYLDEGPRSTDWLAKGVIKQHRTLATYINTLLRLGFAISHVEEWGPTARADRVAADLADERQRPPFLLRGGSTLRWGAWAGPPMPPFAASAAEPQWRPSATMLALEPSRTSSASS